MNLEVSLSDYAARHDVVLAAMKKAAAQCGVHVLDVRPYLCDGKKCAGIRKGQSLYQDDHHLNQYGSRLLKPLFDGALKP